MNHLPSLASFNRRSFLKRSAGMLAGLPLTLGASALAASAGSRSDRLRVRVWCEGTAPRSVYPDDIDGALADHLALNPGLSVRRARLSEPAAGLSDPMLDVTDVLIWWGHLRHDDVPAGRADAIVRRVREGTLGLIALHASCASKPFRGLMGQSCEPGNWREDGQPEHVTVKAPDHPIARGVTPFTIPRSDRFAEPFDVPPPETVVLQSAWDHGDPVRSGLTWTVDKGRVVYLRTGHDAFPVLFHPAVRQLVTNAALWVGRRS